MSCTNFNCIIAGVGGQGTVLASRLISAAATARGMHVVSAETIGMAQRGGSVLSHIRIGDGAYAPLIGEGTADLLIAFEPCEGARALRYLKRGGVAIVCADPVAPASGAYDVAPILDYIAAYADTRVIEPSAIYKECGSRRVLNVALLGAALAAGVLPVTADEVADALGGIFTDDKLEMNLKALRLGGMI